MKIWPLIVGKARLPKLPVADRLHGLFTPEAALGLAQGNSPLTLREKVKVAILLSGGLKKSFHSATVPPCSKI